MNKYTIYCTAEQTKRAFDLGAPIQKASIKDIRLERYVYIGDELYTFPTAEEMMGWMEKQSVNCFILRDMYDDDAYNIQINEKLITTGHTQYNYPIPYDSRKEATLAAIDAALDCLIDNDLIK